jgi:hypothetical protein
MNPDPSVLAYCPAAAVFALVPVPAVLAKVPNAHAAVHPEHSMLALFASAGGRGSVKNSTQGRVDIGVDHRTQIGGRRSGAGWSRTKGTCGRGGGCGGREISCGTGYIYAIQRCCSGFSGGSGGTAASGSGSSDCFPSLIASQFRNIPEILGAIDFSLGLDCGSCW